MVQLVRAMAADEAAGRDPRRLERQATLAAELGRQPQAVRMRLSNAAHVLREAGLPAPDCLPTLPGVGRRIAAMILDAWRELEAGSRRPWTEAELVAALAACRRMAAAETRLGQALGVDEAGDIAAEVACQTGRRWSETRRVMAAVAGLTDGPEPRCLQDVKAAALETEELEALSHLQASLS